MIDPYLLFEKVRLQSGMHAADFGCGRTGQIVFPAAKVVGPAGLVYAIDIIKDVLEIIRKRAKTFGYNCIQTVWTNLEWVGKTAIPPKSLDVIFIVNTLVESDNRHGILEEAYRLLKDKARMVIVDWSRKGLKFGPQNMRFVDFEDIINWSKIRNFVVQEEFDAGPFHRGLVLYKHE